LWICFSVLAGFIALFLAVLLWLFKGGVGVRV